MYRAFTWLHIPLWRMVRAAPAPFARFAALFAIAIAVIGLTLIAVEATLTAGPVTEVRPGARGELSLARVGLPGRPGEIVALMADATTDDLRADETWLLAMGAQVQVGEISMLKADRFIAVDARPDPRDWIPETARTHSWALIAVGLGVLVFAGHVRMLVTAAGVAALGAAMAWHGLHLAAFFGWISNAFVLQPVVVTAGAVIGLAGGLHIAAIAPAGLIARLAAIAATLLLLPWSQDTLALPKISTAWPPEDPAAWLPILLLAVPALLPALALALAATLLLAEGYGLVPGEARGVLVATVLIMAVHARYSDVAKPYISSLPDPDHSDRKTST